MWYIVSANRHEVLQRLPMNIIEALPTIKALEISIQRGRASRLQE